MKSSVYRALAERMPAAKNPRDPRTSFYTIKSSDIAKMRGNLKRQK